LLVDTADSRKSLYWFITTDAIFHPKLLESFAEAVEMIFHD
jgi:hypothetical protein